MRIILCALLLALVGPSRAQTNPVPQSILIRIVRAEDHRDGSMGIAALLQDARPAVRRRAFLAAGRIGDVRALPALTRAFAHDPDVEARAAAAFALGLIASPRSAPILLHVLHDPSTQNVVRARAVEALGKIVAALPPVQTRQIAFLRGAIYSVLSSEHIRPDRSVILLALTAALRAGPSPNAGKALAPFLSSQDARVRADTEDVLARLHIRDVLLLPRLHALLTTDTDPDTRANAARALAAAQDMSSENALAHRAEYDPDVRVRVSAVRALGSLKSRQAVPALLARARTLQGQYDVERMHGFRHPAAVNELLEIAVFLGQTLPDTANSGALVFLSSLRSREHDEAPELEVAAAQIAPQEYILENPTGVGWRIVSARAQGLGALTGDKSYASAALAALRLLLQSASAQALPDVLRAFAGFHAPDARAILQAQLNASDIFVRAAAAELLGDLPPDPQTAHALTSALPYALHEQPNDAARYILGALAAQHTDFADRCLQSALSAPDRVVRARAADLLRINGVSMNGVGDFSLHVGTSAVRLTDADYRRAVLRRFATATVHTAKGIFIIELLPQDAPLTVDSFIGLARRGFFHKLTFHRVVPDFVVQGGDPRGDGNGGPGYALRDEFNPVPYGRGTVGMALDGPDTGGSQWFVTHAPQPHLDGHYTVFGQVVRGMDVVDRIARGDRILSVDVTEGKRVGYTDAHTFGNKRQENVFWQNGSAPWRAARWEKRTKGRSSHSTAGSIASGIMAERPFWICATGRASCRSR